MKIPKIFVPEKNLEGEVEILLKKEPRLKTVSKLLESCEEFLKEYPIPFEKAYKVGVEMAKKISYTKEDLEDLILTTRPEVSDWLGIYLSALVNKIITKKDILTLTSYAKLSGLGVYLKKGTLIINGSTDSLTGSCMSGGMIKINGDAGRSTGSRMKGGTIIVKGNVEGDLTGYYMKGGEIRVKGYISELGKYGCRGRIYQNDKLVWSKWIYLKFLCKRLVSEDVL